MGLNILDKIVAHKKAEIAAAKKKTSASVLEGIINSDQKNYSLATHIRDAERCGIIAEFKRRSPSKPTINLDANIEKVTQGYVAAGVSGLSVLTDSNFFGGSTEDLKKAREINKIPILRKDFIIDEYQILEAKTMGADAILLIAEILSENQVRSLSTYAKNLNLEVLMELHSADQLGKYHENVDLIGVNNRDLKKFKTDIAFSKTLINQLPKDAVKVSESGISNPSTIKELKDLGYQGFLIGERFMMHADPGVACQAFIKDIPL